MRLVDEEQRAIFRAEGTYAFEETWLGEDDSDVRESRFHDEYGDITVRQPALHRREIVELRNPRRRTDVNGWADIALARRGTEIIVRDDEGLIDRTVVAVREGHDLGSPGDHASQSKCPPIGIGRREAE